MSDWQYIRLIYMTARRTNGWRKALRIAINANKAEIPF